MSMKTRFNYLELLILFVSQGWCNEGDNLILKKDPFNAKHYLACQKLKQDYLTEISDWRWLGIFTSISEKQSQSQTTHYQLWLINSHNEWLYLEQPYKSVSGLSWQIETIEKDKLTWQIHLPDYCLASLTYIMPFAAG
jgi:hypothetical protein